jgi:DoxX-like family
MSATQLQSESHPARPQSAADSAANNTANRAHLTDEQNRRIEVSAMQQTTSKRKAPMSVWVGRVMSGMVVLFLLLASAAPKLFMPQVSGPSMEQLGWTAKYMLLIACIEIIGAVLYAIPRTAVLGAILLTGLFGGAIATHLRIDNPLFSHTLFALYLGVFTWGGLWLRDPSVRALFTIRLTGK